LRIVIERGREILQIKFIPKTFQTFLNEMIVVKLF
jgi:hypothetical protein